VARIQSLWLSFDIDFDGNISLSEMAVHMQKNGKRVDMQSLKLAFDLVDKDRSGRISFCGNMQSTSCTTWSLVSLGSALLWTTDMVSCRVLQV